MNMLAFTHVAELAQRFALPVAADGFIGLRPEHVVAQPKGQGMLQMQVDLVEALGAETLLYLSNGQGLQLVLRQSARSGLHSGQSVGIDLQFDAAHFFDAQGRSLASGGGPV